MKSMSARGPKTRLALLLGLLLALPACSGGAADPALLPGVEQGARVEAYRLEGQKKWVEPRGTWWSVREVQGSKVLLFDSDGEVWVDFSLVAECRVR